MNFLALLLLSVVATPPSVTTAEPVPELDAKFHQTGGWVGGDGVYSVTIDNTRTLWLFSDTFVGLVREGKRRDVAMVNNTVGVQAGSGSDSRFAFSIGRTDNGKPKALFAPPDGRGWFWLNAGVCTGGTLHVFLPRLEKTRDPGAFGFRSVDLWLGTVANAADTPTDWKPAYLKVPFGEFAADRKRSFGSALLRIEDQVYIYGYDERPGKPFPARKLLIARVPADKIADFNAWRFYSSGEWKAEAKDASGQGSRLATEFSVTYLPGLKQYLLVYTENGLSDRIVGRFSETPVGPWSDPMLLYTCPEMKRNKNVFTYAAKAHPHLAGDNELIVSYVANAFESLKSVIDNAELYQPRFVRIAFKK